MDWIDIGFRILRWGLTAIAAGATAYGVYLAVIGFLPALWRLGNGLRRRKIAIFAKGDDLTSLSSLFADTKLFSKNSVLQVSTLGDVGRAEDAATFLVHWPDWEHGDLVRILALKKDRTALVVFAPQGRGRVPEDTINLLEQHRNVVLVNFRGRLLNDVIISLITTGYE